MKLTNAKKKHFMFRLFTARILDIDLLDIIINEYVYSHSKFY